ncbi:hypothetical protein FGO68_gene14900 [Halteria grandinella]|uniref:Uncharacterized protein n=1 Tax=Halteria grandinella TaxID=5974 RepID=A0A8J8NA26_HALGN|nr:hypothetical protein FGO68_gene14900 [Halteria grandinella]
MHQQQQEQRCAPTEQTVQQKQTTSHFSYKSFQIAGLSFESLDFCTYRAEVCQSFGQVRNQPGYHQLRRRKSPSPHQRSLHLCQLRQPGQRQIELSSPAGKKPVKRRFEQRQFHPLEDKQRSGRWKQTAHQMLPLTQSH